MLENLDPFIPARIQFAFMVSFYITMGLVSWPLVRRTDGYFTAGLSDQMDDGNALIGGDNR
jgi:hypothetical protein